MNNKNENISYDGLAKRKEFEPLFNSIVLFYLKDNAKKNRTSLKVFVNFFEKKIIRTTLNISNGNQKIASEILGIKPTTLNEKIKKYNIRSGNVKANILKKINEEFKTI